MYIFIRTHRAQVSSDVPLQCMQTFSVLRVFLGRHFCHDALQLPLRLTLREVTHLVVLRGNFHQPRTGRKQTLVTKPSPQRLLHLGHIHTASAAVLLLNCTRSQQGGSSGCNQACALFL